MNVIPITSDRPTVATVAGKVFLFLSAFRRAVRRDSMTLEDARDRMTAILLEVDRLAQQEPELHKLYQKARYLLHVTVDGIVRASGWEHAVQWPLLELRHHGTADGGTRFFELLEDPAYDDPELLEVFYLCLGIGFRGQHRDDPERIEELMKRLYLRLPGVPRGDDQRITPQAYEHLRDDPPPELPLVKIARLGILAVGIVLLLSIGSYLIYRVGVADIHTLAARIAASDHNT
ncbi:MAG: DotU family type IV/VI secretion system protein [Planctomycetes bacterium]|nr:DotU family type IV/VI secretion system protein [Planctomycetota bacterium]